MCSDGINGVKITANIVSYRFRGYNAVSVTKNNAQRVTVIQLFKSHRKQSFTFHLLLGVDLLAGNISLVHGATHCTGV